MGVVNFDHGSTYKPAYSGGSSVANRFTSNKQLRLTGWRVHVAAFGGNVSLRVFRVSDGVVVYAGSQVSTYSSSDVWLEFTVPGGVTLESGVQYSYGVAIHAGTKVYTKSASTSDHNHTGDSGGVILATKAGGWLGSDVSAMPSGSNSNELEVGLVYTTNTAPNAPTLTSPAAGSTIDRTITQRLAWAFSDPDPGDSQSKFDLHYRPVGAGTWTDVTGTTPNQFWDAPPATFAAGDYEWQARTYDAQGVVGPYSSSSFFTAATAPAAPTITAPVSGGPVAVTDTLTWSTPVQDDYQARRVADNAGSPDTGTVYWDSGDVTDATTRSLTVGFPTNNRWEHVQVRVKDGGLWSPWADVRVQVSWTPPASPTLVLTPDAATASLAVAITNPAPGAGQPTVSYNDVYLSAPGVPEFRAATLVAPSSSWTFWTPASGLNYTVRVVSVASNGTTAETVVS